MKSQSIEDTVINISRQDNFFKFLFRTLYRSLPFKRQVMLAFRAIGLGELLPTALKGYLVFKGPFSVTVEGRTFVMLNGYGRQIEATLFWDGLYAYERSTLSLWTELAKRSQVILDIGANTGIYALLAKTLNPSAEVHAFEPISRVHSILCQNVALNEPSWCCTPLIVHQIALSDYTGEGEMFDLPVEHMYTASLNNNIHAARGNPMAVVTEIVRVRRLDEFLNEHDFTRVDLIKIDTESHEPMVLAGLGDWLQRCHPSLIVEIWDNEVGKAVESVLLACDYLYFALT